MFTKHDIIGDSVSLNSEKASEGKQESSSISQFLYVSFNL